MSGHLHRFSARSLLKAYLLRSRIFRDNSHIPPLDRIKTETLRMTADTTNTGRNAGYYLGVDIGSLTAKAVVVDQDGAIRDKRIFYTGASSRRTMARLRESILEAPGFRGQIRACVATGYGRFAVDFADREITEISCHARGMAETVPWVRTIVDIGGQDTKAVSVDENGAVQGFVMNDKCAAGTGRFM